MGLRIRGITGLSEALQACEGHHRNSRDDEYMSGAPKTRARSTTGLTRAPQRMLVRGTTSLSGLPQAFQGHHRAPHACQGHLRLVRGTTVPSRSTRAPQACQGHHRPARGIRQRHHGPARGIRQRHHGPAISVIGTRGWSGAPIRGTMGLPGEPQTCQGHWPVTFTE